MNVTAHRSMVSELPPPPDPGPPEPAPDGPGPKPPPRILSARPMTALVSHGPEETPGPLDPYIRKALERSALGSGPESLPTRSVFLAAVIMEFTERMTDEAELAELTADPGGEAGDLVVAGQVARFVDEVCGNGARLQWPFPWPEPRWYPDVLTGADLTVMGTQ